MQAETSGHGYSTGREIRGLSDLLDKTGSIKLVATEAAQNALTSAQEFRWGDVFMSFKYQNKGGKLYANGRALEDINDVNEIGGDRIGRVITALNQMVLDSSINESIVVSEDLGYGRHFIYRYRKGDGDNIEGLAFEYQGTQEELGEVVNQLGRRAINRSETIAKDSADFSRPLFFAKNKNDIADLSKAALNSFESGKRRSEMSSYLNRLKRDTEGYEELKFRRQMQEKELEKQYENLILKDKNARTGIANAVFGMIGVSERMIIAEDRRRKESIKPLQYIIQTLPGTVDRMGRLVDQNDAIRVNSENLVITKENISKETNSTSTEQIVKQVIEPIVPGIIGLLPFICLNPAEELDISLSDGDGIEDEDLATVEKIFSDMLIGLIPFKHIDKMQDYTQTPESEELKSPITNMQQGLEIINELLMGEEDSNIDQLDGNTEKNMQRIVTADIVKLGEETVRILLSDKNITALLENQEFKPQVDTIAQLSLLLQVYNDENSSNEVKNALSLLMYWQIKEIRKDNKFLSLFPKLDILFLDFNALGKKAGFLDERIFVLVERLEKLARVKILDKPSDEIDIGELVKKVLILIYYLSKKHRRVRKLYIDNIIYNPEMLTKLKVSNYRYIYPKKKKNKKCLDTLNPYGIIYQYNLSIA